MPSLIIDEKRGIVDIASQDMLEGEPSINPNLLKFIDSIIEDILPQKDFAHSYERALYPYEKRVDFAAIEKALDSGAVKTDLALRVPIRKVLDDLIALMKNQDKAGGITQSFVQSISLTTGPEAQKILGDYLLGIWRKGRELAAGELPRKAQEKIRHFEVCPTGEGGGIDPTCSSAGESGKAEIPESDLLFHGTSNRVALKIEWVSTWAGNPGSESRRIMPRNEAADGPENPKAFAEWVRKRGYDGFEHPQEEGVIGIVNPKKIKIVRKFAGLEPFQAINFFQNLRPWLIKGIIDDELKKTARLELTEHLKGGRTLTETIGNLRDAWEPWIGDPTKVIPSGITGMAEDILQAYRLENIIRTEVIGALSQGRAQIADEAGDFVVGFELSPILDVDTHLPLSETRGSLPCNRIRDLIDMDRPVRFKKDDPRSVKLLPPLLYNCRTIEIFITTDDLPVRWSTEAELDSVLRLIPSDFK